MFAVPGVQRERIVAGVDLLPSSDKIGCIDFDSGTTAIPVVDLINYGLNRPGLPYPSLDTIANMLTFACDCVVLDLFF